MTPEPYRAGASPASVLVPEDPPRAAPSGGARRGVTPGLLLKAAAGVVVAVAVALPIAVALSVAMVTSLAWELVRGLFGRGRPNGR